jgi:hypothetical protein
VAEVKLHQPLRQAQRWNGSHRFLGKGREPSGEDHLFPAAESLVEVLLHQPRRPRVVARGRGVPDRLIDQPVMLTPGGGPPVEFGDKVGLGLHQSGTEEIAEQMMEAVPAALLVQGNQEQVGPLEVLQHVLAIGAFGDRAAQWTTQPLQDGGSEQELPDPVGLSLEHLLAQVVEDVAMGSGEGVQKSVGFRVVAQGQRGQLQSDRPAFGPGLKGDDGLGREFEAPHLAQERCRLLGGKPEVRGPQFTNLAPSPKPGQGKGGSLRLAIKTCS